MELTLNLDVTSRLPDLIQVTSCNDLLLSILEKRNILSRPDLDQLKSEFGKAGAISQSKLLFHLIQGRVGGHKALVDALYQSRQTKALLIMLQFFQESGINNPFSHCHVELQTKELLKANVQFQDRNRKIEDVVHGLGDVRIKNILLSALDSNGYESLMTNPIISKITICKTLIPSQIGYYKKRVLSSYTFIDPRLFGTDCPDIFVVKGLELCKLSKLASSNGVDRSRNQSSELTVRFIEWECDEDFEDIKLQTNAPIHLIQYDSDSYHLLKSFGDKKNLRRFMVPDKEFKEKEKDFINKCLTKNTGPVSITASPGMGKTFLLVSVAREIKRQNPLSIVIFVVLREFINMIPTVLPTEPINNIIKALAKYTSKCYLGSYIATELIKMEGKQKYIFFDGYDEISPEKIILAKTVLKSITLNMKNTQVFVTARPHLQDDLEDVLGVLSHNILPLVHEDQVDFLTDYWVHECQIVCNSKLIEFAKSCVTVFDDAMKDSHNDIAGIPLLYRLLAEVYAKEANKSTIRQQPPQLSMNSHKVSIFFMYQKLMERNFQKISALEDRIIYKNIHLKLAVMYLFQDFLDDEINNLFPLSPIEYVKSNNIYTIGLLEKKDDEATGPCFSHRTFAEYLVAEYICEVLSKTSLETTEKEWIKKVLSVTLGTVFFHKGLPCIFQSKNFPLSCSVKLTYFIFKYPVICFFLNAFLKGIKLSDYAESIISEIITTYPSWHATISACVAADFLYLFRLFQSIKENFGIMIKENDASDLLILAANNSNLLVFKECTALIQSGIGKAIDEIKYVSSVLITGRNTVTVTPLHIAAARGNFLIVEFILKSFPKIDKPDGGVLHLCVNRSSKNPNGVITQKIQIVKVLLEKYNNPIIENTPSISDPPLLMDNIHFELIKLLIYEGADLQPQTRGVLYTIAHKAATYLKSQEYEELVHILIERGAANLFNQLDVCYHTPVHTAVRYLELHKSTLKKLKDNGIHFNNVNRDGDTELFRAVISGRSINMIQNMVELGADWNRIALFGYNILHWASKYENVDAVSYFISLGVDVNARNEEKSTPLHLVLRWGDNQIYDIARILVENGADVNAKDVNGRTPLEVYHVRCVDDRIGRNIIDLLSNTFNTSLQYLSG